MTFEQIAERIYLNQIKESEILTHYDYRKGKDIEDLKNAITSALKKANNIQEFMQITATNLSKVFKHKRKSERTNDTRTE